VTRKYKNSVRIEDNIVSKKKNDSVLELYDYLDIRNFSNYPKVLSVSNEEMNSEYIEEKKYHEITKGIELIKTIASLHLKTFFYKDISKNKYKEIYDKILGNINYLKDYYEEIISDIETEIYMSPSHYLFARNYSAILGSLKYSSIELNKWYNLVKDKTTERVCIVHNNISNDHFVKGDQNYLLSWDNYLVDTPILDLFKYYKKDGFKLNFKLLYEEYNKIFSLLKEEDLLFKALISLPPKIEFINSEYENTIYIQDSFEYIYRSYKIVN
jgi:hypothetical protein